MTKERTYSEYITGKKKKKRAEHLRKDVMFSSSYSVAEWEQSNDKREAFRSPQARTRKFNKREF